MNQTVHSQPLMRVEPLPDIRDGILVERLVKAMRYVAEMRGCQYVVQCPEGVRRRHQLNVEYVDRGAGDSLMFFRHADQSSYSSMIGPRDAD